MDYIPVPFWPGGLYLNVADLALIGGALSILWGTFKIKNQKKTQKEGKP
jgi:signal peptidase II